MESCRRRYRCYDEPQYYINDNNNNTNIKKRNHSKWGELEFIHEIIVEGPLEEIK